nr:insulinase family protein [Marinifaba aquimaris]
MADLLATVTWHEFVEFYLSLFDKVHIEALIYGDNQQAQLDTICNHIKKHLLNHKKTSSEIERLVYQLPQDQSLYLPVKTDHQDQCVIIYYQAPEISEYNTALYTLLNQIVSPIFFHTLRTEKQLGYMLGTGYMPINQCPGFIAYIQSNKAGVNQLTAEIDKFFSTLPEHIASIPEDEWENLKSGLSHQLLEKDTSMRIKAQRFWMAIGLKDETFKRRERIAMELTHIDKQSVLDLINQKLNNVEAGRLVIGSETELHNLTDFNYSLMPDIEMFQKQASKLNLFDH